MEECRVEALKKVQEREELYKGDSIIKQSRNYGPGTTHKHYSRSKTKITKGKKTRVSISESSSSNLIKDINQRSKRAAEGFRPDRTNIGKNYYSKVLLYSTKTYKVTIDDKTVECECYSQCHCRHEKHGKRDKISGRVIPRVFAGAIVEVSCSPLAQSPHPPHFACSRAPSRHTNNVTITMHRPSSTTGGRGTP